MNGQKAQLDTEKHDNRMIMLLIVLVRNVNHGRDRNGNTSKKIYLEAKKKYRRAVSQGKCKAGKDLKMYCRGMIRKLMCLRLKRGWLKLIRILVVGNDNMYGDR